MIVWLHSGGSDVDPRRLAVGGDPRNVMLSGQSGGAFDACAQLTSPSARGLSHSAIMESGSCAISWPRNGVHPGTSAGSPWRTQPDAEAERAALATRLPSVASGLST